MTIKQKPMSEIVKDAIYILTSQLGPANTARFIHYFSIGFGNYTEERKELFDQYTVDDIVKDIQNYKNSGNSNLHSL